MIEKFFTELVAEVEKNSQPCYGFSHKEDGCFFLPLFLITIFSIFSAFKFYNRLYSCSVYLGLVLNRCVDCFLFLILFF